MKKTVMVAMLLMLATFTTKARQKPAIKQEQNQACLDSAECKQARPVVKTTERFRVLISTDIGGTDPDDNH